jgi:hypothetical protein
VTGLAPSTWRLLLAVLTALFATRVPTQTTPPDTSEIQRLIEQLGSPNFAEREATAKRLNAIGESALDSLRKAAAGSKDAEIRRQSDSLVKTIEDHIYTEVRRFEGHVAKVACIAFSSDGKRALSGSEDKTVRLWEVPNGKELRRFEVGCRSDAIAISPDGHMALSGGIDGFVRLWDMETGKEIRRLKGHKGPSSASPFRRTDGTLFPAALAMRYAYGMWRPAKSFAASSTSTRLTGSRFLPTATGCSRPVTMAIKVCGCGTWTPARNFTVFEGKYGMLRKPAISRRRLSPQMAGAFSLEVGTTLCGYGMWTTARNCINLMRRATLKP